MQPSRFISIFFFSLFSFQNTFAQWVEVNAGIPGLLHVNSFASNGTTLLTGGIEDLGSLILCRTTTNGNGWVVADSGIVPRDSTYHYSLGMVMSLAADSTRAFASASVFGIPPNDITAIYLSRNGGVSWHSISPLSRPTFRAQLVLDGSRLFAFQDNRIFRTTNDGASWDSSIVIPYPQSSVGKLFVKDSLMIAFLSQMTEDALYRSSNGGATWQRITNGIPTGRFSVYASQSYRNSVFMCGYSLGLLKSTDNGLTWTPVSTPQSYSGYGFATYRNTLFYASGGVIATTNEGATWTDCGSIPAGLGLTTIWVHGDYLFWGSIYRGVWRRPLSQLVSVSEDRSQFPSAFVLHQNYPNPFNPETNISFDLPKNSFVTLKIFNLIGQEVATIVNTQLEAGRHAYKVSGEQFGLSSGMYLYQLKAGNYVRTKKCILLK